MGPPSNPVENAEGGAETSVLGILIMLKFKGLIFWRLPCQTFCSGSQTITVYPQYLVSSFVRSSGPGGQHVNKVNTKADVRFSLSDAQWLPDEVMKRLSEQQSSRINKHGELVVSCQETRSQQRNLSIAIQKLQEMVNAACVVPKERKMRQGLTKATKEKRIQERKRNSLKKAHRAGRDIDY